MKRTLLLLLFSYAAWGQNKGVEYVQDTGLEIKSTNYRTIILTKNEKVGFKLKSKQKVKGKITHLDVNSFTVLDELGIETKITKEDILAIRNNHGLSIATHKIYSYYTYHHLKKVTFKLVYEKYNATRQIWTFD